MNVYDDVRRALAALATAEKRDFRPIRLMVIGCSTSEITGGEIGHASNEALGEECARAALDEARLRGYECAFQCCEHLNRALVVERLTAEKYGLEIVSAVPFPKAGGSLAAAAYRLMTEPVLAEAVRADAGIDIGQTLIGMHLTRVAVPVRTGVQMIGNALVTCARTRPPLIGGERARYAL